MRDLLSQMLAPSQDESVITFRLLLLHAEFLASEGSPKVDRGRIVTQIGLCLKAFQCSVLLG